MLFRSQSPFGQELLCFDLDTGNTKWRRRYAFPWEPDGLYPGPFATPTIDGDRVFFADCFGKVLCSDLSTGALLWQFDVVERLRAEGVDFGYSAVPLVVDGRVYCPAPAAKSDALALALDSKSGEMLWATGRSRQIGRAHV